MEEKKLNRTSPYTSKRISFSELKTISVVEEAKYTAHENM
jgi:hypothetical protein